jgi:hypothetical protein
MKIANRQSARAPILTALCAVAALAACVHTPATSEDFAAAQAAARPINDDAAQLAVMAYFAKTLPGSDSAQYSFNALANGAVTRGTDLSTLSQAHDAGWFMCGTVSTKNHLGVYGQARPFYAHFDPAAPNTVQTGAVEDGDYEIVSHWCRVVYGTNYLPQYE